MKYYIIYDKVYDIIKLLHEIKGNDLFVIHNFFTLMKCICLITSLEIFTEKRIL